MSKPTLPSYVARTIRTQKLFSRDDTIIVALSGGADSCALLDILAGLSELSPRLVIAHINHCLRGNESDSDETFARWLATHYGFPFESCQIDVAEMALQQGLNLEDAGRRARMVFLEQIRVKHQAQAIVLAHHADDQAETVLMRLLRGSGMTGLSGMAFRNGHLIRPLLDVSRGEIENYLESRKLKYRNDASNRDTTFLRNRIRHELMPLLSQYNPNIRTRLNTTARLLADEKSMLDGMAAIKLNETATFNFGNISLSLEVLNEQPVALKRRIFRLALEHLAGNCEHFSYQHIEALQQMSDSSRPNTSLNLPQGIIAVREYGTIILRCSPKTDSSKTENITVNGVGSYQFSFGQYVMVSHYHEVPDFTEHTPGTTFIDLEKAPFPWQVRTFKPGDRIMPLGIKGTKKVKDLFIDEKVPLSQRGRIPLIFSNGNLIWICGLRSSDIVKIDSATNNIVKVVFTKI